jgi:[histone H3]-lysine36 N-dimethyltransferase SETMAR
MGTPMNLLQSCWRNVFMGARDLLERLSTLGIQQRNHVVTGDQTWVYVRNYPSEMWGKRNETTPVRVKRSRGDEKVMLTVLFSRREILLIDFLPIGQKFNSQYMTTTILPNLISKIKENCPRKGAHGWFLHLDNSPVHNCQVTTTAIENSGFSRLPHPPYSPDLAPSDFSLFGYLNTHLRSKFCSDIDELKQVVVDFLTNLPTNWLESVFDEWVKRLKWVIENQGQYYVK